MSITMQILIAYFLISGLCIWLLMQPKMLEKALVRWEKRHKNDEDYKQEYSQLEELRQKLLDTQSSSELIALTFGWFILPFSICCLLSDKLASWWFKGDE